MNRPLLLSIIWMPVAVYDGCCSVAFVYRLRLKQYLYFPWRLSPIDSCDSLGAIWGMGCLVVVFAALLCMCAMKGIPIGPLAQWGKDLTYYLTPIFCLGNLDMYYPGSACRETDLPPGRIIYIHTFTIYIYIYIYHQHQSVLPKGRPFTASAGT